MDVILFIPFYSGIDGGLVLATTIQELNNTVQNLGHVVHDMKGSMVNLGEEVKQLGHVVHDMKDSMVSCFLSLNESVTNLARKIPSPVPSPTQPGTNASIQGDNQAPIPVNLQFEDQVINEADNNAVEEDAENVYSTDSDHVQISHGYTTFSVVAC